mmetsp:Transcript_49596/g.141787  ORF Transcript_49596/g.141787 Transcript_49596/m.141787 type:complete len:239 (-) Transcript_49596:2999-3715(-)
MQRHTFVAEGSGARLLVRGAQRRVDQVPERPGALYEPILAQQDHHIHPGRRDGSNNRLYLCRWHNTLDGDAGLCHGTLLSARLRHRYEAEGWSYPDGVPEGTPGFALVVPDIPISLSSIAWGGCVTCYNTPCGITVGGGATPPSMPEAPTPCGTRDTRCTGTGWWHWPDDEPDFCGHRQVHLSDAILQSHVVSSIAAGDLLHDACGLRAVGAPRGRGRDVQFNVALQRGTEDGKKFPG